MTNLTSIETTVRQTLSKALGRPVAPNDNVIQGEEPLWDSLKHVELMFMLEEEFGIALTPDDFAMMTSVDACVAKISLRLSESGGS